MSFESDSEILKDTRFDREVAPKTAKSDLLVSLLKNNAFSEDSAILLSKYPIKPQELDELISRGRVELISNSPIKIYLTRIGKIVAYGEFALRNREKV
ncbi:MAG: hypothetical protein ACTSSI_08465 [Candidatus Helarchaeota archaeon]